MPSAAPGPYFGPGPVRSQWQPGQSFELRTPVAQLLLGGARSQPRSLPLREMPVLDGKVGQLAAGAIEAGPIERLELFPEQPLRPSVRDKVMKLDHQRMVAFVQPQQPGLQRRFLFKIEGVAQRLPCLPLNRRRSPALCARAQVEALAPRPRPSPPFQQLARTPRCNTTP